MSSQNTPESPKKKNFLEWTVFGLSLVIVISVIGALVYQAVNVGDDPPRLAVTMESPLRGHGQVRIPLQLTNDGDLPALEVVVEISGMLEGKLLTSTVRFDYVTRRAQRAGWVTFPGDTVPENLSARVLGYADP